MGESSEKKSDPDQQEIEAIAEELSREDGVNHCISFSGASEALKYFEAKLKEEEELTRLREELNRKPRN